MAKYFYVPYEISEDGSGFTRGMIVRASKVQPLLNAIDEETHDGSIPPELVIASGLEEFAGGSVERAGDMAYYIMGQSLEQPDEESLTWLVQYREPRPHPSLDSAMDDARSEGVYSPHFYRLEARGGLQAISIGDRGRRAANPRRLKNTHDPIASTEQMYLTLFAGVRAIEDASKAQRDNDLRAALGTAQWELGQSWTHAGYSSLSAPDMDDAKSYIYELGMLVHEFIADDKRPTHAQANEARTGAEQLVDFLARRDRAANPSAPNGSRR